MNGHSVSRSHQACTRHHKPFSGPLLPSQTFGGRRPPWLSQPDIISAFLMPPPCLSTSTLTQVEGRLATSPKLCGHPSLCQTVPLLLRTSMAYSPQLLPSHEARGSKPPVPTPAPEGSTTTHYALAQERVTTTGNQVESGMHSANKDDVGLQLARQPAENCSIWRVLQLRPVKTSLHPKMKHLHPRIVVLT